MGWRVNVTYQDVRPQVPYDIFVPQLLKMLPEEHSPFSRSRPQGRGNQGYLYELPLVAGQYLLELIGGDEMVACAMASGEKRSGERQTTSSAVLQARRGQGQFRADLDAYWGARCAVTGLPVRGSYCALRISSPGRQATMLNGSIHIMVSSSPLHTIWRLMHV